MPKEAIQRGAAQRVLPLSRMAGEIMAFAQGAAELRGAS
jgi:two-component system chemotaxis response regulator CheB